MNTDPSLQPVFGSAAGGGPVLPVLQWKARALLADPLWGTEVDVALVAIVATVVLVGLVVGGWLWHRYRYRSPGHVFRDRLAEVEEVAVLMHPKPDPDAMASAIAVGRIARDAGAAVTIQYPGEIRHPENRAFLTVLDLDIERIDTAEDLAADAVVLVDHNEPRGFEGAGEVTPYAIVDHHPHVAEAEVFADVRPEYGACATIVTEYLDELAAERLLESERTGMGNLDGVGAEGLAIPCDLATGLAYGILSDTTNLTRGCSESDFDAMEYLYPGIDEDLLDRIANPTVAADVLETRARAILERDQRTPYAVSDVGAVETLDAIPQAADDLLQLEGVTAVAVLGEKDGSLYVSGRSRDDRVHVGHALEAAVANVPGAGAGGHARMSGGQVPLEELAELRPASGVLQTRGSITREDLHDRLFEAMRGAS